MSAVISSAEDVVNAALVRIGVRQRIGSMLEGSAISKLALDVYGQTRDELLRSGDWGFASGDVTLTLLKTAPAAGYGAIAWSTTYPPLPWKYEYTYPTDCLKVKSLRLTPIFLPEFDPQPILFDVTNDSGYSPARKVIVANIGPVVIMDYTRQVTDPTTWEVSFTDTLIDAIGEALAPSLNPQMLQAAAAQEQMANAKADMTQG